MSREHIDLRKIITILATGVVFAVVWFGIGALLLWPFGKAALCGHLAKGYCLYFIAVLLAYFGSGLVAIIFRMETDPPRDPYVIVNIFLSAFVQIGWAAFAALAVKSLTPGASFFAAAMLYTVGLVASWVTTATLAAFFQGSIYRMLNAWLALAGYLAFAAWPAAGRALYGWLFAPW